MARTLLVTTDFSTSSKAGIRFAIQLAEQAKYTLVFYHCMPYLKPTRWSDAHYDAYVEEESAKTRDLMAKFVGQIYRTAGIAKPRVKHVVEHGPDITAAIVNYAGKIGAAGICLSTRGAGRLKRLIGTHAVDIIHRSPVPVFVIPRNYRKNRIRHILYASDLVRIATELKAVRHFAKPLKAKISVYHYDYLADVKEAKEKLEKVALRYKYPDVEFRFQKDYIDKSLATHLVRDVRAINASLVALFTNQTRGWFDRLFLSSQSANVAFDFKVPLIIIPKGRQ